MNKILGAMLIAAMAALGGCVTDAPGLPVMSQPLPRAVTSGYARVNGADLYYATFGKGEPVLLLHGAFGNSENFYNQVPEFARHYRVIVMDTRGLGRSTRDQTPYTYELLADDVAGVLDTLQIPKAAIVGLSDGANIGLAMAIHHRDRLTALFAYGANYNPAGLRDDVQPTEMGKRVFDWFHQDYARLSKTPGDWDGVRAAMHQLNSTGPDFTLAELAGITTPTAIVDGQNEQFIKPEHTVSLAHLIPGAKLIILPGVGHGAPIENPQEFNQAALSFLAGALTR